MNLFEELREEIDREFIIKNADMSAYTYFKTGGTADYLIIPQNKDQLVYALQTLAESGIDYMVIGNGSNLLVREGGYRGAIIKLGDAFSKITVKDNVIKAEGGAMLAAVAKEAALNELTGLEFASGIPGSIGGAVFMNAGAYESEMKDIITEVRAIKKDGSEEKILWPKDLELSYRHSAFHDNDMIVLSATMKLAKGNKEEIYAKMKTLAEQRNSKQPMNYPSCGSFFKRPKNNFAGKLIQDAGLRGYSIGGAQVSELHCGFIINRENAKPSEIEELMVYIQDKVKDKFNVYLEPEVRIIGESKKEEE